ncbi:putative beta-1 [Abeliophyllum distichum]|uniref:Beta-1 n=1 Tax=Abeliophyllum distichum TaxID=126358 RepID=A0ABD1V5A4_9LAMI
MPAMELKFENKRSSSISETSEIRVKGMKTMNRRYALKDTTRLSFNGDIEIHSTFATSLPASDPSFSLQRHLVLSNKWKAPAIPNGSVELLVGNLSAGNHFSERMVVTKSSLQHKLIKSSNVVACFFVALVSEPNGCILKCNIVTTKIID